jgi:hypothetical protein
MVTTSLITVTPQPVGTLSSADSTAADAQVASVAIPTDNLLSAAWLQGPVSDAIPVSSDCLLIVCTSLTASSSLASGRRQGHTRMAWC